MARTTALVSLSALAIFFATVLSGCAWLGKGMEVSDAYNKASEAKTGAYLSTLEVKAPKSGSRKKIEEYISASGAFDNTNADHPMSRGEVTIDGDTTSYVEPGNGRIYVTEDGKTDYMKIAKDDRPEGKETGDEILEALAGSVINFRDAPPITSRVGLPVPAISAEISRTKLCGESLRAAARQINATQFEEKEFKIRISNRAVREGTRWCSRQLPTAPQLTFGIENGMLTDYALEATIRDGKRVVSISWQLQLIGLDQPQTGFKPPKVSRKSNGRGLLTSAASASDRANELIESIPSF